MISAAKRKQLEAAGYSISKSGDTVTKDGGTVAGINGNGKVFGSGKAFDILKGSSRKDSDTKGREKPKESKTTTSSRSSSSSAPSESKRPKQRQTGRGEPNYGKEADKPVESTMGGPRRGRKPTPTRERREGTTLLRSPDSTPYEVWKSMSSSERRAAGLPESTTAWQNQDVQKDFRAWWRKQLGLSPEVKETTGSSSRKSTRGMAKGGMVRKGNTSYKDKGMFYKSASPRGFK